MLSSKVYRKNIFKGGESGAAVNFELKHVLSDSDIRELEKRREQKQKVVNPVEDLKRRRETVEREAYEVGFKAGEEAGLKMGEARIDSVTSKVDRLFDELSAYKENFYKTNEKELVKLVTSVAGKVVHAELRLNSDVIYNVLKSAVSALVSTDEVVIRLNSEDLEYLRSSRKEFIERLTTTKGFYLEACDKIEKGDCVIESNHGEVDVRLEESLKVLEKSMKEVFGSDV